MTKNSLVKRNVGIQSQILHVHIDIDLQNVSTLVWFICVTLIWLSQLLPGSRDIFTGAVMRETELAL